MRIAKNEYQHNTNIPRPTNRRDIVSHSQGIVMTKTNKHEGRGKVLSLQDTICMVSIKLLIVV